MKKEMFSFWAKRSYRWALFTYLTACMKSETKDACLHYRSWPGVSFYMIRHRAGLRYKTKTAPPCLEKVTD